MKQVGKVTHYYGKIGVAIVELEDKLKTGDKIKVEGGKNEFEQEVGSIELEHEKVESAKKGDVVGLKVDGKTRVGAVVYRADNKD